MKSRYCYSCGRRLVRKDFLKYNSHQILAYLIKLWNHPSIEFYCCECYKGEMLLNRGLIYFPEQKKKIQS